MTDQSNTPEPPKSLLERAESMFGLAGYKPAKVPRELKKPVNRRPKRATPKAKAPEAISAEPAQPASAPVAAPGLAQRVLVCSPHPDEGKSYCAVNLALALAAEKDCEVLLVDADFAKPSVLKMLGLPKGPGFMDVLARDDLMVEDCVLNTDIAGLYVLPAGNHTTLDSEYLASHRTAEVLDRLTRAAPRRIVIFDSPPALAASQAAELANHVGQAIVVARADRTGQNALEDALTLLSSCPDLKLLLNAAHFSPSGRRFGAYYGEEV